MDTSQLKYDERGLIPCIVQDDETGEVLMMAWMNAESVALTLEQRTTWFWSRSRAELWHGRAHAGTAHHLVLVAQPCRALAQGCHERQYPAARGAALRLRCRLLARTRDSRRPRLPYRQHVVLLPDIGELSRDRQLVSVRPIQKPSRVRCGRAFLNHSRAGLASVRNAALTRACRLAQESASQQAARHRCGISHTPTPTRDGPCGNRSNPASHGGRHGD